MAAIFPPPARGGVPPGPSIINGFSPTNPVIGEGPYYVAPQCSTVLTDAQMNALTSEVLAAVDELGFAFNTSRIDNLGQALRAAFEHVANDIAAKVSRAGDTMSGALILSGPPANDNEAASRAYVDDVTSLLRAYVDQQDAAIMLANQQAIGMLDAAKVDRSGDTMAGPLMLAGNPSEPFEAATKQYVDTSVAAGGHFVDAPLDGRTFGRNMASWVEVPGFMDIIRYSQPQALTEAQQTQTRQNISAAPFDALAFNGYQIDGGMEINQVAFGQTVTIIPGTGGWGLDLWLAISSNNGATVTVAQVTDAPPGYRNSFRIAVTTAAPSLPSDGFMVVFQDFEGTRIARMALGTAQGMPISIAMWVKAHRPGLYSGCFRSGTGTGDWGCPFPLLINQPDTWEYKTATLPPPPVGIQFATGGSLGAQLIFNMAAGSGRQSAPLQWTAAAAAGAAVFGQINGVAATSDYFQITGIVVLPGVELPPQSRAALIMRSFEDELRNVQRYYNRISTSIRFTAPAAFALASVPLHFPTMRTIPAATEIAGNRNNIAAAAVEIFTASGGRLEVESWNAGDAYAINETIVLDARV